jgi:hypothetical protein
MGGFRASCAETGAGVPETLARHERLGNISFSGGLQRMAARQQNQADHQDNPKQDPDPGSNTIKDPDDWTTGDERMTGAQASYLKTLCEEAGEEFDPGLTKADASRRIDELQARTGRGR